MGNWNYKSSELVKLLREDTIQKGGVQQITTPIISCKVASDLEDQATAVKMGGYQTLVNYNKHREKQHKREKQFKRERSLKKQIKRFSCCNTGLDFPKPDLRLNKEGDIIK